jgi:ATP-dependent Lon protease
LSFHYVDDAKEVLALALLIEQVKSPVKFVFQAEPIASSSAAL